jgi:hypothetical protein
MSAPTPSTGLLLELTEEFVGRCRKGQRPPLSEYMKRHPELAAEIRELFPAIAVLEHIAAACSFVGKPAMVTQPKRSPV